MLYISRYVGKDYFGVVDTDDNVEEVVSREYLSALCKDKGITVEGIIPRRMGEDIIRVVQPESTRNKLQTKLKVLKRIEVLQRGSIITAINWQDRDIKEPVSIRLSDFGTMCADFLFMNHLSTDIEASNVKFILDDNIEYSTYAFNRLQGSFVVGPHGIGATFDLTELCDAVANRVYGMLVTKYQGCSLGSVSDNMKRKAKMMAKYYKQIYGG